MSDGNQILVIDDDDDLCVTISDFLSSVGYNSQCVTNAELAFNILREKQIDLAIVDILMPDKDGVDTIMDIDREFPDTKVIAISGGGPFDRTELLSMAEILGADAVLPKPFDFQVLQDKVAEVLGGKSQEMTA